MTKDQIDAINNLPRLLDTIGDAVSGLVEAADQVIAVIKATQPTHGSQSHADGLLLADAMERIWESTERFVERSAQHLPTLKEKTREVRRLLSEN